MKQILALLFLFYTCNAESSLTNDNEIQLRLKSTLQNLVEKKEIYLGYPETPYDDNSNDLLSPFQNYHLNNVGDPWEEGNWDLHTKQYEREVISFFSDTYHINHDFWGYVTNGGTEGNLLVFIWQKNVCLKMNISHF